MLTNTDEKSDSFPSWTSFLQLNFAAKTYNTDTDAQTVYLVVTVRFSEHVLLMFKKKEGFENHSEELIPEPGIRILELIIPLVLL